MKPGKYPPHAINKRRIMYGGRKGRSEARKWGIRGRYALNQWRFRFAFERGKIALANEILETLRRALETR